MRKLELVERMHLRDVIRGGVYSIRKSSEKHEPQSLEQYIKHFAIQLKTVSHIHSTLDTAMIPSYITEDALFTGISSIKTFRVSDHHTPITSNLEYFAELMYEAVQGHITVPTDKGGMDFRYQKENGDWAVITLAAGDIAWYDYQGYHFASLKPFDGRIIDLNPLTGNPES